MDVSYHPLAGVLLMHNDQSSVCRFIMFPNPMEHVDITY